MFHLKVSERIKPLVLCSIAFFLRNRAVHEIMWKKYGRATQATGDNVIRCTPFAWWITKATDTHTEYVILTAFPWQKWLCEGASALGFAYVACLVT
jgi:light-regulated signal transduction histidine kinase (bacteriophytochrome)